MMLSVSSDKYTNFEECIFFIQNHTKSRLQCFSSKLVIFFITSLDFQVLIKDVLLDFSQTGRRSFCFFYLYLSLDEIYPVSKLVCDDDLFSPFLGHVSLENLFIHVPNLSLYSCTKSFSLFMYQIFLFL